MKALILAAGLGTRLRPITDNTPKPLVVIDDKPLLWYHLESLKKYGIREVLINTHYLSEKVDNFVKEYSTINPEMSITTTFEDVLLGSAGTLKNNINFFKGEENFFIIYGDNLTNINYKNIYNHQLRSNCLLTIASYYENHPESKGIIVYNQNNIIEKFIEKPKKEEVISNYANAGIYVVSAEIFKYLNNINYSPIDFGSHVFPPLLENGENMSVYLMREYLLDIGTLESYKLSQTKIKEMTF